MLISLNTAISALDTPSSLLPFFVKDSFDITGRTIMAHQEGGKHEAREKFIEEAGTSLFWIGGIPAGRALANLIFKNQIDTDIHFKRINSEGIQCYHADELEQTEGKDGKETKTAKFSKEELQGIELGGEKLSEIKSKLAKSGYVPNGKKGFYKTFHVGTTTATVLVNLVILSLAIPKLNQYLSRVIISKEVNGQKNGINPTPYDTLIFEGNNKANKPVSFGSLGDLFKFKDMFDFPKIAEAVQLEPVSGMLLLDYGISGSRVTVVPRNNNERVENLVKEGGIIFFFYYAAGLIKKALADIANKWFKTPIGLDYKVLNCPEFITKLKKAPNKEEITEFVDIKDKESETKNLPKSTKEEKAIVKTLENEIDRINELNVIRMIDKELATTTKDTLKENVFKNFTLQMAQKEGLVDVEYDEVLKKWIRHSKKYIEIDKIISLNENIKNFYEEAMKKIVNNASGLTIEKILSKTKKVKIASIIANMVICCASLSFVIPKIQYIIREHRTKTKSAPGIKLYQDLAQNNQLKV